MRVFEGRALQRHGNNDAANWSCVEDTTSSVVQQADEVLPDFGKQEDGAGDD